MVYSKMLLMAKIYKSIIPTSNHLNKNAVNTDFTVDNSKIPSLIVVKYLLIAYLFNFVK